MILNDGSIKPIANNGESAIHNSELIVQMLPLHHKLIEDSGISVEVARVRGYRSSTSESELAAIGFADSQRSVPALLIPIHDVHGQVVLYQARPDTPREINGKAIKYETPSGARMALDVPPLARPNIDDPTIPLFITEGARKADAAVSAGLCCISLLGVWNWRGTNAKGGKTALACWESIALNGRDINIIFDSDVTVKPEVRSAQERLSEFLTGKGAKVSVIDLPPGPNGEKVGLDDYLASGHTVVELLACERAAPPPGSGIAYTPKYEAIGGGLVWQKPGNNGTKPVQLTNFTAVIKEETVKSDGVETTRSYLLKADTGSVTRQFQVPASEFPAMHWVGAHLGAGAILFPGFGTADHARTAIQMLSGRPLERIVYSHTGWTKLDEGWAFLHAGGAIGANGPVSGIEVDLPDKLGHYRLPVPPAGIELVVAILDSLALMNVAPDVVSGVLLAGAYRVVLGPVDLGILLVGKTGERKTAFALTILQHFGAGFNDRTIPAAWSSTANALEGLAFAAKDVLLLVDDFVPGKTEMERNRIQKDAERLFRAQGNLSGRQRMKADATLRATKWPRGMILCTGEDMPLGQSLQARMALVDMPEGGVDLPQLTDAQKRGAEGSYARAMAGYLQWLAPHHQELHGETLAELRNAIVGDHHGRVSTNAANLMLGLQNFLSFAEDKGAISRHVAEGYWQRGWNSVGCMLDAQWENQASSDPVERFKELLLSALSTGKAFIAGPGGAIPPDAGSWGWEKDGLEGWRRPAHGELIGWLADGDLYLEPRAALKTAKGMCRDQMEGISSSEQTLHRRMKERGVLLTTDADRRKLTVRRTIDGVRRNILHVRPDFLLLPLEAAHPAQSAHGFRTWPPYRPVSWAECAKKDPKPPEDDSGGGSGGCPPATGPNGPIGPVPEAEAVPLLTTPSQDIPTAGPAEFVENTEDDFWPQVRGGFKSVPDDLGIYRAARATGTWCHGVERGHSAVTPFWYVVPSIKWKKKLCGTCAMEKPWQTAPGLVSRRIATYEQGMDGK